MTRSAGVQQGKDRQLHGLGRGEGTYVGNTDLILIGSHSGEVEKIKESTWRW